MEFYPRCWRLGLRARCAKVRYVNRTPGLRTPLIMMALIGTLAYEFQVSLLLTAKYTFHGDGGTYGLMTSAMGVGAVVGGLVTASRASRAQHAHLHERRVRRSSWR